MENSPDFLIDFENMPSLPITLESEALQEANAFLETGHKGSKVYMCAFPNCSKSFKYLSQANRHSIVHNKDRPLPCTFPGCNKSFKRADILESHMQIHAENLSYACNEPGCNRKFASRPALKWHEAKHATQYVFRCEIESCDKSFLHITQLKEHIKEIHPNALPPATSTPEEDEGLIDPEFEKDFQGLLRGPYNRTEWKIINESERNQQAKKNPEHCRGFVNYVINQMRMLKEQARNANQKAVQIKDDNAAFGLIHKNSFSDFAKFAEQFGTDELKFLEFLKDSPDNDL